MINNLAKPVTDYSITLQATDKTPLLKIEAKVYAEPVATTDLHQIYSTIEIREEDDNLYGIYLYETMLDESQVKEFFTNVSANPVKFKNR